MTLKSIVEYSFFGVCDRLGEILGVSSARIRLFFLYATFLGLGSPVFVYMCLAFVRNLRRYFRAAHNPVWEI
jgi:phage shock protein PspC (stress-responsive transcriptional regulator)